MIGETLLKPVKQASEMVTGAVSSAISEEHSEAHKILRSQHGHPSEPNRVERLPGIVPPGSTGVIYVTDRANANGFKGNEDPEWANFGQGAPEVGPLPNAPERPTNIDLAALGVEVNEYAPTTGVRELREAVATMYNELYRKGKQSQYSYENVCIVPGGRAGLTRIAAVIGDCFCSYSVPEYTAYDALLGSFSRLVPLPAILDPKETHNVNIAALRSAIRGQGVSVSLLSNPKNPTGKAIAGEDLKELVSLAADGPNACTLVLDEFYSAYAYDVELGDSLSAANYIEDIESTSAVLINGATKCWRLPGWRVCWILGPKKFVQAMSQSGSFLDGGASSVMQHALIPLLEPSRVRKEFIALQRHFKMKRDVVLKRLGDIGLKVRDPPSWTFYIWLDLSCLPAPINNGLVFFEECLREKVIVVPGIFFDINPTKRRNLIDSPCSSYIRLSFGPPLEQLQRGLDAIERVVKKAHSDRIQEMGKNLPAHPPVPTTEHGGEAI